MPDPKVKPRYFSAVSKVLLIEPPNSLVVGFNATVVVEPLGLEFIAGSIADMADVKIFDMRVDQRPLDWMLNDFKPDLVGLRGNYTVDVRAVLEVARQVKEIAPGLPLVVGGHHLSLSPHDAYSPHIDAIVIGDGEIPFRNLLLNINGSNRIDTTTSVIFQDANGDFDSSNVQIRPKTALKQFDSAMMNERPIPSRHLVDHYRNDYYFLYHGSPYSIETARGCIYRCNFCSVHEFHRGEYRMQGIDRTLQDLQKLPKNVWVNVVDDLAIQELPAAIKSQVPDGYDPMVDMAEQVIQMKMGHRYWMQVRADNVVRNPAKFEKWAEAGLDTVLIGLESFDQNDLNSVSKGSKTTDNTKAIEILHSFGIRIWGGVLIFQAWQERNFDDLKQAVLEHDIEFPQFTIMTPLPGTKLWRDVEKDIISTEPHFYDFLHSVLPTRLSPKVFYQQYASLWRTVGAGGMQRARKMLEEVATTRQSVTRFLRQYKTLADVETYQRGIEMLERASERPHRALETAKS